MHKVFKKWEKETVASMILLDKGIKPKNEIQNIANNEHTLQQIKDDNTPDNVKIINLVKSIEKAVDDEQNNLMLLLMRQKAEEIQERYEDTQTTTIETLTALEALMQQTAEQKKEQAEKQFNDITSYFHGFFQTQEQTLFVQLKHHRLGRQNHRLNLIFY